MERMRHDQQVPEERRQRLVRSERQQRAVGSERPQRAGVPERKSYGVSLPPQRVFVEPAEKLNTCNILLYKVYFNVILLMVSTVS